METVQVLCLDDPPLSELSQTSHKKAARAVTATAGPCNAQFSSKPVNGSEIIQESVSWQPDIDDNASSIKFRKQKLNFSHQYESILRKHPRLGPSSCGSRNYTTGTSDTINNTSAFNIATLSKSRMSDNLPTSPCSSFKSKAAESLASNSSAPTTALVYSDDEIETNFYRNSQETENEIFPVTEDCEE